jgi:hypothetical protein
MNFEMHPNAFRAPAPVRGKPRPWLRALVTLTLLIGVAMVLTLVVDNWAGENLWISMVR